MKPPNIWSTRHRYAWVIVPPPGQKKKHNPQPPPDNVWWQPAVSSLERKGWGPKCHHLIQAPDTRQPFLVAGEGKRKEGGDWWGCWSEITRGGNDPAWCGGAAGGGWFHPYCTVTLFSEAATEQEIKLQTFLSQHITRMYLMDRQYTVQA